MGKNQLRPGKGKNKIRESHLAGKNISRKRVYLLYAGPVTGKMLGAAQHFFRFGLPYSFP